MRVRRKFQEGGLAGLDDEELVADDDTTDDEVAGPTASPTQQLLNEFSQPSENEKAIMGQMRSQADQVRAALRTAKERLQAERYNPGQALLAASAALGSPTRTGQIGESFGQMSGALAKYAGEKGEFDRNRDDSLSQLDTAMAGADKDYLTAQLGLEKINKTGRVNLLAKLLSGSTARSPADYEAFKKLADLGHMTPEEIDRAVRVKMGTKSRAGQYTVRTVNGVPTLVGIDSEGAEVEGAQIPLSTLVKELGAKEGEKSSEAIGTGIGKQYVELQDKVLPAQERLTQLDRMGDLLEGIETGRLTPIMTDVASVLDYFGIKVDPNLDKKQAALTIASSLALQNRNPSGGSGMPGAMSDADRKFLTQMTPGLSQTPEGRKMILETAAKLSQRDMEVAALAREYKKAHGTFDEFFYDELGKWATAHPLFPEGGNNAGPKPKTPDQLSPEQRAEYEQLIQQQGAPQQRARGGHIKRHYQTGGSVVLSDGTVVTPDAPEEEAPAIQAPQSRNMLEQLMQLLPMLSGGTLGAAAGVGAEELGSRAAARLGSGVGKSERTVLRSLQNDMVDPNAAVADLKRGQRAGVPLELGDMGGPHTRALSQEALLAASPAEAIRQLESMQKRHDSGRDRVEERVNKGLKPYSYFEHLDKLNDNLYTQAKPLYDAAYEKGSAIKETPEMRQLLETDEGQKAIAHAMSILKLENTPIGKADAIGLVSSPSLQFLDLVKRGWDQQIQGEEKGGPTDYGRALRRARKRYVEMVDAAAPEEYRAARKQYAGDLEVRDALEEGRVFHQFQPEELASQAKAMSFAERNAFRTGMAQRLHELISAPSTDANTARKIIGSPATVARLEPFFDSKGEFRVFKAALEREAELFERSKVAISRGERGIEARAAEGEGSKMLNKAASGVRALVSPLGVPTAWALRVIADRPKMSDKEAERVLEVLRRNDPVELANFARRAGTHARFMKYRTGRRAGAAALGAAAGAAAAALAGDDEE
jgi:hypothetical protein